MSLDEAFAKLVSEREAKLLRPAASQIAAATREYGFVRVYVLPSIDSLLATAILANVLSRNNVRFTVSITLKPPLQLDEPTILLGYPVSLAEEITARKPSALIGYGEQPSGLLQVQVAASTDTSVAALTAAVLSEVTIVGEAAVYGVIAGYWRGLDRGKKAEFQGFEKALLEMLKLENKVEEHFTVRLFRWNKLPTEEALYYTLDPYLHGLTGDRDACVKFLAEDPRLAQLRGKTVNDAPEEPLTVLGAKLYELIKEYSRIPRRPSEIIGYTYYYRPPLLDLREAALILSHYAETVSPYSLAALGLAPQNTAASAYYAYTLSFPPLTTYVRKLIDSPNIARKRIGRIDAALLPDKPPSILLADRILRLAGVIPSEAVPVYSCGERYCTNMELLLQRLNYNIVAELSEAGCLEPYGSEGVAFNIAVSEHKC